MAETILVPDGLSLVSDHGHNVYALTAAHVAFEIKDLLPGKAVAGGVVLGLYSRLTGKIETKTSG